MAVQTGQKAPDFTLFNSENEPWQLSEHLGDQHVVLLFFPGAFTGVCTDEMCTVNDDLSRYDDLNADVVGVSTDAPAALKAFAQLNDLDFTLLSDHDATVSERYGAKFSSSEHILGFSRVSKRAAFVIGAEGTVRYAEVMASPLDQPDFDAIQKSLEESS